MSVDSVDADKPMVPPTDGQDRRDSLRQRISESTSSGSPADGNNNKKKKRMVPNSSSSKPDEKSQSEKKRMVLNSSTSKPDEKSQSDLREDYIKSLNGWMAACSYWRMYHTMLQSSFIAAQFPVTTSRVNGQQLIQGVGSRSANDGSSSSDLLSPQGRIYKIPDVWKRVTAELIDFFLLLIMKIFVTYIAIEFLDLVDLSKFDLSEIDFEELDTYQFAIELTSEILVIETVHRFIVILFETVFLMRNLAFANDEGGSTPGKKIMGLRVVSCSEIRELPGDRIKVTPGGNIGFGFALLRALIKNFSSIFFLPASLTVFVSIHNRAAYDIACRCIVVEDVADYSRPRRR